MTDFARPRRVLVAVRFDANTPDDLAEGCRAALTQATALAEGAGAHLALLHVIEPPVGFPPEWMPALLQDIQQTSDAALDRLVDDLRGRGLDASGTVRTGEAWYEILAEADATGADVIVVASRGTARLEHFIFGSTALRLMRKSAKPVWVVHPSQKAPVREILVPIDFGGTADESVATGNLLHEVFGARCIALHCVHFPNDLAMARLPDARDRVREYHDKVHADAEARLSGVIGDAMDHWSIRLGHAALQTEIEKTIQSDSVDLVILGSISRTGIRGLLTGNTAERIFAAVDCSLWVLKPTGWQSPVTFG
jgi:universal stress protein E